MQEKRRTKRMDIDVKIKMSDINSKEVLEGANAEEIKVKLVNVSEDGIAFETEENLDINTYYDASMVIWCKETFESVIEIVRMEKKGNKKIYGCRFVGITPAHQFKIKIHELIEEAENNQ